VPDRLMPGLAPLEEMLWNLSPAEPIVVLATLSAVAVVVVRLLPVPVAATVPPPVAVKAVLLPVDRVIAPEKLTVAPVLLFRKTPVLPLPLTAPPRLTVLAVAPSTSTTRWLLAWVMLPP
jgi:hypothetical protein